MDFGKMCSDCGETKPLEAFYRQVRHKGRRLSSDGHRNECKECHQKKTRAALLKRTTPEQRRKYIREYMRTYKK